MTPAKPSSYPPAHPPPSARRRPLPGHGGRARRFCVLWPLLLLAAAQPLPAATIHGGTMVAAALQGAKEGCLEYSLQGVCVWATCDYKPLPHCVVALSPIVKHFMPDLAVTSFSHSSPWWEVQHTLGRVWKFVGLHGGAASSWPQTDVGYLNFKRVEVLGNPATTAFIALHETGFVCSPVSFPYAPYFLSSPNFVSWRTGLPDSLRRDVLLPGRRGIGVPGERWDGLFPRMGFSVQVEDAKAGFVAAFRAAHVVSLRRQPFLYFHPSRSCGGLCDPPGELREDDPATGKWQQLLPEGKRHCAVVNGEPRRPPVEARYSETQQYAWNLWRPYRCCKREGEFLLKQWGW